MKKDILPILVIVMLFVACTDKKEELKEQCKKVIQVNIDESLKKEGNIQKLDSLRIIKVDTITPQKELVMAINYLMYMQDHFLEMSKLTMQSANLSKEIAELEKFIKGYSNQTQELSRKTEIAEKYMDSLRIYNTKFKELTEVVATADSVKFLNYRTKVLVQLTNKDMVVNRDTAYYIISPDFKIVEPATILKKHLGNLYKE